MFPTNPNNNDIHNSQYKWNGEAWEDAGITYGISSQSPAASAKSINNAYSGNINDGVYWIRQNQNTVQTFCDMTNSSGGWTAVFKNYGGPGASSTSSFTLFNTASTYNGICMPKYAGGNLSTERVDGLWDYFINKKNIQILKTIRAYDISTGNELSPFDSGDPRYLPVPADVILDLGLGVSFNDIITAADGQQLNNQVEMFINGNSYGKTDIVNKSSSSIGFANEESSDDEYGQPVSNLMDGWGARHVIAYKDTDGMSAVRCQWICWDGDETYNIETVWHFRER